MLLPRPSVMKCKSSVVNCGEVNIKRSVDIQQFKFSCNQGKVTEFRQFKVLILTTEVSVLNKKLTQNLTLWSLANTANSLNKRTRLV
ncbi:CLUMA_CG006637, isoform A [Clunio marinus]|uniref:CLUMA_CG006637, isoform A n=1 Tax=Clunio marinus TaxID=568069 RepID=A0A1J1I0K9_9DIPT|nr:CLUMA_CG006637, isoform A [Clunio marinus]